MNQAKKNKAPARPQSSAAPLWAIAALFGLGGAVWLNSTQEDSPPAGAGAAGAAGAVESGSSSVDRDAPGLPPLSTEALHALGTELLQIIAEQEAKQDATCWTTVRMIESFSAGHQLTPPAEVARIEASRSLLHGLWHTASLGAKAGSGPTAALTASTLEAQFPTPVKERLGEVLPTSAAQKNMKALGLSDQHRTTENHRTTLSVVLDALLNPAQAGLAPLKGDALVSLGKASTVLTGMLVQRAGKLADERQHQRLELSDIQAAYKELREELALKLPPSADTTPPPSTAALQAVRELTQKNAAGKIESLRTWNKLQPNESPSRLTEIAESLSRVIDFPIDAGGVEQLVKDLALFAELLLAENGPFRSDTFANSLVGLRAQQHQQKKQAPESPGLRVVRLVDVFNSAQDAFPSEKQANGDAHVLMVQNIKAPKDAQSRLAERRVKLFAPSLDAVRDTGVHWFVLKQVLEAQPNLALGPFAAEFATEILSEYALFLLQGGVELARGAKQPTLSAEVLSRLEWKYPLGRFFPDGGELAGEKYDAPPDAKSEPIPNIEPPLFRAGEAPKSAQWAASCTAGRRGFQHYMGSGIAVGDFNGDGKSDLFVAGDGCNRLLQNEGQGGLVDVTDAWGLVGASKEHPNGLGPTTRHPLFVDINGDGKLDLFVTQSHAPSQLFLQTDGRFENATAAFGLSTKKGAHSAHFFDYDRDGDLDLYIGYYGPSQKSVAVPSLDGRNGFVNELWQNQNGTSFTSVGEAAGVASRGWTLASAALDINRDGHPDFWLANDFGRDQVFLNQKDGTFRDVAAELHADDRGSGMNVSLADLNHDGHPDVFVSMIEMFSKTVRFILPKPSDTLEVNDRVLSTSYYISGNKLFLSRPAEPGSPVVNFLENATSARIDSKRKGWAWGVVFFDYENDGDRDAYLANGWIEQSAFHTQPNQLLLNTQGRLGSVSPSLDAPPSSLHPESQPSSSRAVAAVDLHGRGLKDLVVLDYQGGLRIFQNTGEPGNFVKVRLSGPGLNRAATGARVTLEVEGLETQTEFATLGSGYLSQTESVFTFGLGEAKQARRLKVHWPNGGTSEVTSGLTSGQTVEVKR